MLLRLSVKSLNVATNRRINERRCQLDDLEERGKGTFYVIVAYLLWGGYALYFFLLEPMQPIEIVVWRMVSSLIFCFLLLLIMGKLRGLFKPWASPRKFMLFAAAAFCAFANWVGFLIA